MNASAAQLMAEKVVRELFRLSQAYRHQLACPFADYCHDFACMLQHADLEQVCLVLCDNQRRTLLEYAYHFQAGRIVTNSPQDHIGGLAVVPLAEAFDLNLIITRKGQAASYVGHLRIQWGDAPTYSRAGGDQCPNPDFNTKTGGRAGSAIYADRHLRQRGRVKCFAPTGQYGFIMPDEAGRPEVFFHTLPRTL
jgi:hypothetical protein